MSYEIRSIFIEAVLQCPELAIKFPSNRAELESIAKGFCEKASARIFTRCIGAIDGFFAPTEKPKIKDAPSNKAVIGRYILPRSIFNKLKNTKPSKAGEIHITDAIQALIKDKKKFIAHNFLGKYLDCGTMQGYIKSTLEINKS